ncbi:MAG: DMT family transporter [Salinigranum sp.]
MSRHRSALFFVALSAVWGVAFVAIKAGLTHVPPVLFAAVRYDVAGVVVLGYAFVVTDPIPRTREEWALVAVGSALLVAGYNVFLFVGESDPAVTSAAASVVVSLSPILTAAFARGLLPEERLSRGGIAGLLFGLLGVAVLSRPNPTNLLAGATVGEALVFGAAASFALGSVLTRRIDAELPIETMEAWSMLGGALLMHLASVGLGESLGAAQWTPAALVSLGYLSVVSSAIGFLLYFDLLDRLGPVEINLVSYVAPVFAALAGWTLLGEVPTVATAVGFALIVLGFLLVKRTAVRRELPRLRRTVRSALDGSRGSE